MALGVNYGAFSLAFSGSLAGLLWRNILSKKKIHIGNREFWWVNVPIIIFTMVISSCVLVGEVYIMRGTQPYDTLV
jgi:Na+/H+ antiporter NhaD/arsenite permease-like protein